MKINLNIIYFLPADNNPSGGIKTILRHSSLINRLNLQNIKSQIIFIKFKKKKFIFKITANKTRLQKKNNNK